MGGVRQRSFNGMFDFVQNKAQEVISAFADYSL